MRKDKKLIEKLVFFHFISYLCNIILKIITTENLSLQGDYWQTLKKLGQEYQRKKQVYYHTEDGRIKHASRFKKIPYVEIKAFSREYKLNLILE